jgi:hypothetical protein
MHHAKRVDLLLQDSDTIYTNGLVV